MCVCVCVCEHTIMFACGNRIPIREHLTAGEEYHQQLKEADYDSSKRWNQLPRDHEFVHSSTQRSFYVVIRSKSLWEHTYWRHGLQVSAESSISLPCGSKKLLNLFTKYATSCNPMGDSIIMLIENSVFIKHPRSRVFTHKHTQNNVFAHGLTGTVSLSVSLCLSLSLSLSLYLCFCLSVCLSVCLSLSQVSVLSVSVCLCLSLSLSLSLSVCLSVCLSVSLCLSSLSVLSLSLSLLSPLSPLSLSLSL